MRIIKFKKLGGVTNTNYLINNNKVLRIATKVNKGFISDSEKDVEQYLFSKGYAPKLLNFDEKSRNKLTKYISLSRSFTEEDLDQEACDQLLKILKTLHFYKKDSCAFDPIKLLSFYRNNIPASERIYHSTVEDIIKELYQKDKRRVMSHNDLIFDNILIDSKNNVFLLDFEYCGLNHPYFDVASLISENNITEKKHIKKIASTLLEDESIFSFYLLPFTKYLDLLWYHWARYFYHNTLKTEFKIIASTKKSHL